MLNTYRRSALSFVLAALCISFSAVTAYSDTTDDVIASAMKRQKIPGLSLVVLKDGKVIKQKNYGLANVELNVPVTDESVFKIASISKPVIATAIMQLVEQGKIGLDDGVSKYFPDAPEAWTGITVRHLLSHTSGIVREAPGFNESLIQADANVIKTAYPLPLRFKPGEKYEYCNVGYFMLAEMIRLVTAKPWPQYIKEKIFDPAGMSSSRVTSNADIVKNRVNAYLLLNDQLLNSESFKAIRPSGAFLSTANDLVRLSIALDGYTLLKKESQDQMWTQFKLNNSSLAPYGLGWQVGKYRGKTQIGHGGSLNGFRLELTKFPEDRLRVIVLTNLGSASPALIAREVAELYIEFPEQKAAASNE